ncbi:hypothetical protein ACFFRN_15185 [Nonomuraea roseola]|uniref:Uncharacterized protein n=1 Tax=Nonomuraea roseola TaxID=46179 RepID=A0ABV5PXK4_9ACTN
MNSETVVMDIDASHATWIDQGRALFVDERGVLRLVDFSSEDPKISVVGDLGRPVTAIDFDAGTSRLAVLLGNDNESASSAIQLVDMKGKVLGKINLGPDVRATTPFPLQAAHRIAYEERRPSVSGGSE